MSSPNGFEFSFLPAGRARGGSSDPLARVRRKDQWQLVVAEHRLGLKALELRLEVGEVVEASVDGREQERRHAVEASQSAQNALADPLGLDDASAPACLARDLVGEVLKVAHLDGALVGGAQHAAHELLLVELLARAVALADVEHRTLDALVGREALAAARALAAAPDGVGRVGEAGVHHAGGFELAVRAMHCLNSTTRSARFLPTP